MVTGAKWIPLTGAANVRDVGGLPAGRQVVRTGRLIRADNLQGLTPSDVDELVRQRHVTSVVDLRTQVEVDSEGAGPLVRDGRVTVLHLSLFPEAGRLTDAAADRPGHRPSDQPVLLPWQQDEARERDARRRMSQIYLRYLDDRPDSVVAALRAVATASGATVVHCAAGKDRTGVVVALALDAVGVDRDAVVEDYTRSAERIEAIMARLAASPTYGGDVDEGPADRHSPRADTMREFLAAVDAEHGGTLAWLSRHGWTGEDTAALRRSLLG